MKYVLLFSLLLPFSFVAQQSQKSVMQEQAEFYSQYKFQTDHSWDSLNNIVNGTTPVNEKTSSPEACVLTKKVFGWHPYWSGSVYTGYNWSMLSDFCYFDYAVSPTTGNNTNSSFAWSTSAAVTAAKSNGKKIHICATLFSSHSTFWASSSAQTTFINNIVSLLNSRGGHGVNIDFEGMGSADKVPFKNFMTNLKNALVAANPNYELSMALYAVDWSTSFDIPGLNPIVTNFIIMGYDYYYSGSTTAGPEAPLYNFQTSYNYTLTKTVTYYLKQGASPSKLLLGLPYYGREWETAGSTAPSSVISGGFTSSRTYSYVKNNAGTYSSANKKWEANCYNPYYSFQVSGVWRQCWIDDIYSMGRKFDMVKQRGLGGIGIWALGYDNGYNDFWQLIEDKLSNCEVRPCTDSLFDMGGPTRNYYDNESYTYSISPDGTSFVKLTFKSFSTEQGYDSLFIYNGGTTSAPLIGSYTGTNSPGVITSSATAVTLRFKSDVGVVSSGFKLTYACVTPTVTSVSGYSSDRLLNIYPNPTNGIVEIIYDSDDIGHISIHSGLGQTIYNSEFYHSIKIDLRALNVSSGVYFISLNGKKEKIIRKLIYQE
jgi:spore germination protein YaaH